MGDISRTRMRTELTKVQSVMPENEREDSNWPQLSYEQGVEATLLWILGETDDSPLADERPND